MNLLMDISEFEGKTIKSAAFSCCDEMAAVIFDDGTYAVFEVRQYGDSYDIELADSVEDHVKRDVGIITQDEYADLKAKEETRRQAIQKRRDLKQLAELQAKYGDA